VIVFDLACAGGHVFEAWFGSGADYETQQARGLVSCPICGVVEVRKAAMAPGVPAKGNRADTCSAGPRPRRSPPAPAEVKAALAALARAQVEALAGSEHVGRRFADEARAIHAGEARERPIHGEATLAEARALVEEGLPVAPLPLPSLPPDTTH